MKKTIDFTKEEIKKIEEYQNKNNLKTFSAAIKGIVNGKKCSCKTKDMSDDKFALIADAIIKLDEKLTNMSIHIAPKSAGEVK